MVPRNRNRVLSNESFIFSASAEESRISSPIASVIFVLDVSVLGEEWAQETHIFQLSHFAHDSFYLAIVLTF